MEVERNVEGSDEEAQLFEERGGDEDATVEAIEGEEGFRTGAGVSGSPESGDVEEGNGDGVEGEKGTEVVSILAEKDKECKSLCENGAVVMREMVENSVIAVDPASVDSLWNETWKFIRSYRRKQEQEKEEELRRQLEELKAENEKLQAESKAALLGKKNAQNRVSRLKKPRRKGNAKETRAGTKRRDRGESSTRLTRKREESRKRKKTDSPDSDYTESGEQKRRKVKGEKKTETVVKLENLPDSYLSNSETANSFILQLLAKAMGTGHVTIINNYK